MMILWLILRCDRFLYIFLVSLVVHDVIINIVCFQEYESISIRDQVGYIFRNYLFSLEVSRLNGWFCMFECVVKSYIRLVFSIILCWNECSLL